MGRATLQEVVGLRPDLAVDAGAPYAARLAAGELRLGKEGPERYRMVLGGAQADDAGTYHCTATEWIQDPDGSYPSNTSVTETKEYLYIGSLVAPVLGRIEKEKIGL